MHKVLDNDAATATYMSLRQIIKQSQTHSCMSVLGFGNLDAQVPFGGQAWPIV